MTDATRGVLGLQESSQRGSDVRDIGLTIEMPWTDAVPHEDQRDVRVVGRPYSVGRTLGESAVGA